MSLDELKKIKESEQRALDIVNASHEEAKRILDGVEGEIAELREKMIAGASARNKAELEKAAAEGKKEAGIIRNTASKQLEASISRAKKNIPKAVSATVKRVLE